MVAGAERLNAEPIKLRDRWNDASGGLGYHWRAWRYQSRSWSSFHQAVGTWLDVWKPDARTLVLVGPSGGYALNARFLSRFERLVALEPDPLARWLLRHRFRDLPWHFQRDDVFHDPQALSRLAEQWPDAAFLFCNVIGQVFPADALGRWLNTHTTWFDAHPWASWHDVFSSSVAPARLPDEHEAAMGPTAGVGIARALWAGMRCEVEDHGTFGWHPPAKFALWPLTPRQWHVIGWVEHTPRR